MKSVKVPPAYHYNNWGFLGRFLAKSHLNKMKLIDLQKKNIKRG